MLDSFLEVACETEKKASAQAQLVDLMGNLPQSDLVDIANGKSLLNKLAFGHDHDWLEKYKGTQLMDQAIALEQEGLQQEMASKQQNQERREMHQAEDAQRDELCIKKRMLDLDLAKAESGTPAPEEGAVEAAPPMAPAPAPAAPMPAPGPAVAGPPAGGEMKVGSDDRVVTMVEQAKKIAMIQSIDIWGRQLARRDLEKEAQGGPQEPVSVRAGRALGRTWLGGAAPVLGGLSGVGGGGALGAGLGGAVGGAPGAVIGGLGGAALGYLTGRGIQRAGAGFGEGQLQRARAIGGAGRQEAPSPVSALSVPAPAKEKGKSKEKKAEDNLLALRQRALTKLGSGEELSLMEKDAIGGVLGAMKGGLMAAGRFLGKKVAPAVGQAAQSARGGGVQAFRGARAGGAGLGAAGLAGGRRALEAGRVAAKDIAPTLRVGGRRAGKWIQANPLAAAGLGAAGLGTAALGGAAVG